MNARETIAYALFVLLCESEAEAEEAWPNEDETREKAFADADAILAALDRDGFIVTTKEQAGT